MSYGTLQIEKMTTESGYSLGAGNASSFKNRIINGACVIDQRNAGASTTGTNTLVYPVDRLASFVDTDGTMTFQQSSVAPAGFTKSVVATTTVADASLGANQRAVFVTRIEGYNIADLNWGTADAKTVTLSFWVRSSLTGTFGGTLSNLSRSYPFTYTISSANTWEYKTVTVAGDTSGTWSSTNTLGLQVGFGLGCGSTFSGTANAWVNGDLNSVTGAVSVIGTVGATWYITGVQLEVGTVATSFDFRSYTVEQQLCLRYLPVISSYLASNNTYSGLGFYKNNTTAVQLAYSFVVPARIPPTGLVVGSGAAFTVINPATVNAYVVTSPAFNTAGFTWGIIDGTVSSGSANTPVYWLINGGTNALSAYFTGCEL